MSKKILFIDPTETDYTMVARTVSPLAASYFAAIAQQRGAITEIIHRLGSSDEEIITSVEEFDPEVICFCSVMSKNRKFVLRLTTKIKNADPGRKIIVGGDDPTSWPRLATYPCIDFIGVGAGEPVIPDFLDFLEGKRHLSQVSGLGYMLNGKVKINPSRKITSLDRLPFPVRKGLPWPKYESFVIGENTLAKDEIYLNMRASMGCQNRCPWCDTWKNYQFVPPRTAENIREEIIRTSRDFKIGFIDFMDADLTADRKWFFRLCKMMAGLNIPWRMFSHPKNVDRALLEAAGQAGCKVIFYGLETVDDARLQRLKGVTLDRVSHVVKMTHQQGIHTIASFMLGWEDETKESLAKVKDYLVKNPSERWYMTYITDFPKELKLGTDTDRLHTNDPLRDRKHISRQELLDAKKELLVAAHNSPGYAELYRQNCRRGGEKTAKSYSIYADFMEEFGRIEIRL